MVAAWIQRHPQQVITYLQKENHSLKAQLGGRRPRLTDTEEVERLMVRMAEENRTWGYRRIQGAWSNLGHPMDAIPVRNVLRRHHLEPVPQRRNAGRGGQRFLQIHWDVLAATDFCTVEVATWQGRATSDVL